MPLEAKALQRQSQKSRQDAGATREKAGRNASKLLFAATCLLQLRRHFLSQTSVWSNYFFSAVGASQVSPVRKHWEQRQEEQASFRGAFPASFSSLVV